MQPPNDIRNFVHKRIGRAVIGFATGGPGGAVAGFARGDRPTLGGKCPLPAGDLQFQIGRWRSGASRSPALRAELEACGVDLGVSRSFAPSGNGCFPGMLRDPVDGKCKFAIGQQVGRDDTAVGAAVMGRYGAALEPGNMVVNRAVCLPGMILGDDDRCYNKGSITNKQRAWPRGRRPLLTGGEMRAISTASSAVGRMERTTKRLQKMGLMKKPGGRR